MRGEERREGGDEAEERGYSRGPCLRKERVSERMCECEGMTCLQREWAEGFPPSRLRPVQQTPLLPVYTALSPLLLLLGTRLLPNEMIQR